MGLNREQRLIAPLPGRYLQHPNSFQTRNQFLSTRSDTHRLLLRHSFSLSESLVLTQSPAIDVLVIVCWRLDCPGRLTDCMQHWLLTTSHPDCDIGILQRKDDIGK